MYLHTNGNNYYAHFQVFNEYFTLLSDKWDQVQYPFTRKKIPGKSQGGREYENLSTPGGFLSVPEHTGLILCADGVQLFKSAKHSIWPILLAVTSLPPSIRMDAENFILAE